ncbi:hypothetical protein A4X06_0g2598 [Tilletia controversa]|uniref:Reverse transcriptase domain-containing protein n=1 Tax=Tilletia controversa TaxID=13291 RepID=A0A8X7MXE3_9BASI|nr:hypothetical protein A4X06_0g2598 [Tilletia controversa]
MSLPRDLADLDAAGGSAETPTRSDNSVPARLRATRAADVPLDPDALNSSPGSSRPRLDANIDTGVEKQGPPRDDPPDAEYDEYGDDEYGQRQSEIDASYVSGFVTVAVQESQNGLVKLLTQSQGELKGLRQEVARVRDVPVRNHHNTARASVARSEATPRPGRFSRVPYAQTVSFLPRPSTDPASNLMLDATNDAEDGRSFRSGGSYGRVRLDRLKAKDMGIFDPKDPSSLSAFNWWRQVAQFMEFSGNTEDEVMAAMPGCFSGPAKTWFSNLAPPPRSLVELRAKVFKAYSRPESQISELLDEKRFNSSSGSLADYLDEKYSLVTELHTARAINRGTLGTDPRCLDAVMTTATVRDSIDQTHRGLPAYWQSMLEGCSKTAEDWTDYRSSILANERRTRMGIAELVAMLGSGTSSPSPSSRQRANRRRSSGPCGASKIPGCRPLSRRATSPAGLVGKSRQGARVVRNTLVALETGTDEQRDAAIQEVMKRRPPSPTACEQAPDENDVPRVRNARSLRVSGYESSESEDEEAPTRYVRAVDRGQAHPPPTVGVPGARHRAVVAHKAAVYIGDARDRFELHVDGGSPLSMITPQALRSIAPFAEVHPPEPLKIRGYRGDDYQRTIGVVVLPVSFPTVNRVTPVTCRFEFHVVADCTRGWILGVDNMKADGIDARSRMERLEFEKRPDAEVKLLQAHDAAANPSAVAHLLCAEDTMVGPRTTRFVKVLGVKEDQIVRPWVFMGKEPESGGAQVPWCVVGPNTNEVELRNDADTPLVLKQGDHLGDLVLLDQESESVEQLQACRGSMDKAGQKEVDGVMRSVAEPDGADVLPEIDIKLPTSLDQTVKASSALSKEQQAQLSRVLSSHAVWPTPSRPIGTYEFGEVSLRLKEDQKDWVHSETPRRTSPAQQGVIDETLAEHDALDISEPSRGPYASGVVLVQQRDKIRFCNDYRPLNKVTVDEYYTMPMTDVVFDRLGKAQYFTVIDLNKGYYQFLLDSASRDMTGFVTFRGLRRYKRMPFGLKSAPAWFQRAMDKTLGAARWEYAIAYLDDVVIFSDTFEDHIRHVDSILASLERAGLTVSPSKCYFGYDSVALLGFRVSSLGLMTDKEKTTAVLEFPEPTNGVEARRFFAMAAWYRRFVANFASRARPINDRSWGIPSRGEIESGQRSKTSVARSPTPPSSPARTSRSRSSWPSMLRRRVSVESCRRWTTTAANARFFFCHDKPRRGRRTMRRRIWS